MLPGSFCNISCCNGYLSALKKASEVNTYPSSHLPRSAPSHKLRKPSKEPGIFQSLGTICSFLLKGSGKKGAEAQRPPPP